MTIFKEYEKVKIKASGAIGTIVDIDTVDGKMFYCIEYDDEFKHLDEEMGIVYCTTKDLEKIV